ncbi:MAG: hypothetical protein A2017_13935 [Lentisphaerae bacterium GWF2_44_16]|nr:MAG: hypothetical protein A2017_13935 [Lentisphaerae bacterium GWF2_44_16]
MEYIFQKKQFVRDFISGLGKKWVIYPAAFFTAGSMGLLALGMVFYLREIFHASRTEIGLFASLWSLTYTIGCLSLGKLYMKISPRYLILAATFLATVFSLMMLTAPSIIYIFLFQGILGFSISLFWPPLTGWLTAGVEGVQLGKIMSGYNISWSLGTILSPFLAGFLSEINTVLPIYMSGFMMLINFFMVLAAVSLAPPVSKEKDKPVLSETSLETKLKVHREDETLLRYPAWTGVITCFIAAAVIFNIFPLYAKEALGFSKSSVGILLLIRALITTLAFIMLGKSSFWHFKAWQMIAGQALLLVCMGIMIYLSSFWLLAMDLSLIGVCIALGYFNSQFHGVAGSRDRSKRAAVHEALLSVGIVSGAVIGGMIYDFISMTAVYIFCVLCLLAGTLVQLILCAWVKRKERSALPL